MVLASNGWTTPADLRQQIQRLWDRGELLRALLRAECSSELTADTVGLIEFPRRLVLKKPTSKQIGEQFEQVRTWIKSLDQCTHVRVEYRDTRHKVLGRNKLPDSVWVDTLNEALLLIGRSADAKRFITQAKAIVAHESRLLDWIYKRPLRVLELLPAIEKLMMVEQKIRMTPTSGLYLRQLTVPGVDTKFIETHRDTLAEWLDLTLNPQNINNNHRGAKGFARRYGFQDKPLRLRMRSLDALYPFPGFSECLHPELPESAEESRASSAQADVTLDISLISRLHPPHKRVLITENEINYLSLPDLKATLALFGAGYGWQSLQEISWLQSVEVLYWGDIDTHGFAILNDLRAHVPHVESLLMDRESLLAHETYWGKEPSPVGRALDRLTEAEQALYQELVNSRYGERVRLEQEQLDFEFVADRLLQADLKVSGIPPIRLD